jgi:leucyl-tRNA synthetase
MDKTNYEFKSIEEKWRKKWEEDKLFDFLLTKMTSFLL